MHASEQRGTLISNMHANKRIFKSRLACSPTCRLTLLALPSLSALHLQYLTVHPALSPHPLRRRPPGTRDLPPRGPTPAPLLSRPRGVAPQPRVRALLRRAPGHPTRRRPGFRRAPTLTHKPHGSLIFPAGRLIDRQVKITLQAGESRTRCKMQGGKSVRRRVS